VINAIGKDDAQSNPRRQDFVNIVWIYRVQFPCQKNTSLLYVAFSHVPFVTKGTDKDDARCALSPSDYDEINDDINELLAIDKDVDLDHPLTAEEEQQLLLDAASFFADKDNLPGGCMCSCCGKCLTMRETMTLDSNEVDLHEACKKLLYLEENESGRPKYTRTVTTLKGRDNTEKTFHLHKDGVIKKDSQEIVYFCDACHKSVTTEGNKLGPETFYELDIGYKPCENEMLKELNYDIDSFVEPTYAEHLCLATVRVTASIHRVRSVPDYTDQIQGRKKYYRRQAIVFRVHQ